MSQNYTNALGVSAINVVHYLLLHSNVQLTPLHVDKLVFFSHGWNLGIFERPCIIDTVEAWKYGPVIPSVYHYLKKYGDQKLDPNQFEVYSNKDNIEKSLTDDNKNIIGHVLDVYATMSGAELIAKTHEDGSPWSQYYVENQRYVEIPNEAIKVYYKNKANKNAEKD